MGGKWVKHFSGPLGLIMSVVILHTKQTWGGGGGGMKIFPPPPARSTTAPRAPRAYQGFGRINALHYYR
jgi:hypothetical protein